MSIESLDDISFSEDEENSKPEGEEDDDEATKEDGEEGEEGEEDKEEDDQDDREDEDEAGSAIDENDYSIDKKTKVALTGDKDCEKECKDKDKKQPDANSNQFLIREGYTTEHRVAIMNREVKYLMSVGKHVLALPVCTEAILLNQSPLSYLNRAHIYKSLKQYEEAIQDFTTVIEHDSINTAASYCQRGICYSKLLDYESAIEDLNKSYQLDPSFSCAFNRGFIFAESGNHRAAVQDFNKIIEGKDEGELRNRSVYYRAVSYVNLKRFEDAKFDLRSILLKDPNALAPRVLLAKAYKFTGHFTQAEECLCQCIAKDCTQPDLFIERSYIRCRMGSNHNLRDAYKDLNKAMTLYVEEYNEEQIRKEKKRLAELAAAEQSGVRESLPSLTDMTRIPSMSRQGTSSRKGSRPLSRQNSGSRCSTPNSRPGSSLKSARSSKSLKLGVKTKRDGSINKLHNVNILPRVVDEQPKVEFYGSTKIASVFAKLAQLLMLMPFDLFAEDISNVDVAVENAEKALSICPDNTSFKMILLTCYLRYEKYDTAFALLEAVLEKDPHNKKALYYKAFCFRAVNDPYNAVDCLTKILALVSKSSGSDTSVDDELLDGESFLLRVLEMRGLLLHEQKAYKFALQDFGRAVCIDSTRAGNFYFRGNCHSKLGNFELAITDFALAEECNFPDLPFLLMCKGVVLRLVGDNESAVAEFDRAISAIEASESKEKSTKILLCRVYLYKSLSIINLRLYDQALENLLKIEKAVDGTLGNPAASKHMSRLNSSHFVVPPGQSYEDIIDPSLRWLVSYHTALSFYMLKRYAESMNVLKNCLGSLRDFVPDDIALGSCIFFYCVSASLVYKSSNPDEEAFMKKCVKLLGECLHTDWCGMKDYNTMLCNFALGKCLQRLENHTQAINHFTAALKLISSDNEIISYVHFRRAWSYKALSNYQRAAADFETAKLLKLDDPNFSINYRKINDIAYIEIDNEPDTLEEFSPIFPSFDI